MMKIRNRLACGLGAIALAFACTLTAGTSADASTSPRAQTDESVVTHFLSEHPELSYVGDTASVADQNAYWKQQVSYWKQVPWAAVAGQWGCTLKSVQVSRDLTPDSRGVYGAGYSTLVDCGAAPSDDVVRYASALVPKSAVLSDALVAAGTTHFAALGAQPAGADAYVNEGCGTSGDTEDCLYANFSAGMNKATSEWLANSTVTGKVRLGETSSSCSEGTQIAISALGEGVQYSIWSVAHSVSVDSTWVSSFIIDSSVYSKYCATF